jgi:Tat protein translocase TatB subunit
VDVTRSCKVFFDIGPLELVAIVVLAVLVFGPDKLPKLIHDAMAFIRKVREFSDSAKEDIRRELGPEFKDFEFEDLNPKTFIRKNLINSENDEYGPASCGTSARAWTCARTSTSPTCARTWRRSPTRSTGSGPGSTARRPRQPPRRTRVPVPPRPGAPRTG